METPLSFEDYKSIYIDLEKLFRSFREKSFICETSGMKGIHRYLENPKGDNPVHSLAITCYSNTATPITGVSDQIDALCQKHFLGIYIHIINHFKFDSGVFLYEEEYRNRGELFAKGPATHIYYHSYFNLRGINPSIMRSLTNL